MRWLVPTVVALCGVAPASPAAAPAAGESARRTVQITVRASGLTEAGGAEALEASGWVWPGAPSAQTVPTDCHVAPTPPRSAAPVSALRVDAGHPLRLGWQGGDAAYGGAAAIDGMDPSWRGVSVEADGAVPLTVRDAVDFGERPVVTAVDRLADGLAVTWAGGDADTTAALEVTWDAGRVVCPVAGTSGWLPAHLLALPGATAALTTRRTATHTVAGGTAVVVTAIRAVPLRPRGDGPQLRQAGSRGHRAPTRRHRPPPDSAPA